MLEYLKQYLKELDEAAEYAELCDHTYTEHYKALRKKRRIISKAIKRLKKIEAKSEGKI